MKKQYGAIVILSACLISETTHPDSLEQTIRHQINILKDTDITKYRPAILQLSSIGDPAVDYLINSLNDKNKNLRISAAETLGRIGDPRAVASLVEMLDDPDLGIRWAAVKAIGEIGDPLAVDPLIKNLDDPMPEIRHAIVVALNQIGDPRAVDPLINLLKVKSPETKIFAVQVVGRLGSFDQVSELLPFLDDHDVNVRIAAVEAFGRVKNRAAVKPLVEILKESDIKIRLASIKALGQIGDTSVIQPFIEILQDSDSAQRIAIAKAIGLLNDPIGTEPVLRLILDENRDVHATAFNVLSDMGNIAVPSLITALDDPSADLCINAATLLGQTENPKAIEPLVKTLFHENHNVRLAVAAALETIGYKPETIEDRIIFYITGKNWKGIAEMGDPAFDLLIKWFSPEEKSGRTMLAFEAMVNAGALSIDHVIAALKDDRPSIRMFAAEALGHIGNPVAIPHLTALQNDESEYVRKRIVKVLEQLTLSEKTESEQ